MTTISLTIPKNHHTYLEDKDPLQKFLSECIEDYIEFRQDEETKHDLLKNEKFQLLNKSIEKKLWDL